jgi:regulator of sirC expression with transglutaminase-like and TPR domain
VKPTRARFAEVVRSEPVDVGLACLLIGSEVDPDLDVDDSLEALDVIAAQLRLRLHGRTSPADVAESMRRVLHMGHRFGGSEADFDDVRSSLLSEVLLRKRGLPILLSVVWTEVAARLGAQAMVLGFPGRVHVLVGEPEDEHVVVDPWEGGRALAREEVVRRAQGMPLVPMSGNDLLLRLLTNLRVLAARRPPGLDAAAMRLWAVELSLLLPRHPVALRRERGELLVRLGDHLGGAEELETYALVVDGSDEQAADAARREARQARAQLN